MFSDLAVSQGSPVRRWTALVSFSLQAALVGAALVYPLFHVESLPTMVRSLLPAVARFESPDRPQRNFAHAGGPTIQPIVVNNHTLLSPRTAQITGDPGPVQLPGLDIAGSRHQPGIDQLFASYYYRPLPTISVQPHMRTSVMMEGNLIHKVEPEYPAIAKQLHIQGTVSVKAIISRDGMITRAEAESGQTLLAQAALAAVRQWRYRPYYLNHEPIEVETEITVNCALEH